jgi:hypothetical protein
MFDKEGQPKVHIYDFTYVVQIRVQTTDVYIAKSKDDLNDVEVSSGLPLSVSAKGKKYKGIIVFNTCNTKSPYYRIPYKGTLRHFMYHRVSSHYYENNATERYWLNAESCSTLNKTLCIDSDGCKWNKNKRCMDYTDFNLLPLQKLNIVMKPYKYYVFTEYELTPRSEDVSLQDTWFKPNGLWFAQGDEWLQHMKKTSFRMSKYNYIYEIQLNKDDIYFVNSLRELQEFSKTFGVFGNTGMQFEGVTIKTLIDWKTFIKREHVSGIVISPNIKKIFYKQVKTSTITDYFDDCEWYVTWDIASGALWNIKGMKSAKLIYQKEKGILIPYNHKIVAQAFPKTLQDITFHRSA